MCGIFVQAPAVPWMQAAGPHTPTCALQPDLTAHNLTFASNSLGGNQPLHPGDI